jgi:hypothetical protein
MDAEEYKKTHGGSLDGYAGGEAQGSDASIATMAKYSPLGQNKIGGGAGRPKREDFPEGLDGMAQFSRAVRSWQQKGDSVAKDADTAQKKALSRMQ